MTVPLGNGIDTIGQPTASQHVVYKKVKFCKNHNNVLDDPLNKGATDGEVENNYLWFVQMAHPDPIEQVGPRVTPKEGKTFMDNNTTLDQ